MIRHQLVATALAFGVSTSYGNNCDSIRAGIVAKIRASGTTTFTLTTVASDAQVTGKVVGTCDLGSKKIVYTQVVSAAPAPSKAKPQGESILTECKDGSVSVSGDCKK
jgi:Protein of unknown function (DUF1161)